MQSEKYQFFVILLVVFISFIGSSIPYPIFPPLFLYHDKYSLIPLEWGNNYRSIFLGITLAAYPLGQFLGSPILGGYSDQYGRKKTLIFSLLTSTLGYVLSAIALYYHLLWTLIISRIFTGMMEGNIAIARAMASDLPHMSKYKTFGSINAVASIGYVMGPLVGGILASDSLFGRASYAFPFFVAAVLSAIALILAGIKLKDTIPDITAEILSFSERFNIIGRFQLLFKNVQLKQLLIVSSLFTLGIDIFYEFGPVYLTGTWHMSPAYIAIYNTILSLMLALGSSWLPHKLVRFYAISKLVIFSIITSAILLGVMVLGISKLSLFLLFGLIGLTIALATTLITIEISDIASHNIQGEVMGTQLSLRMLGDAIICLIGGILIISSIVVPLVISSIIVLLAALFYVKGLRKCTI